MNQKLISKKTTIASINPIEIKMMDQLIFFRLRAVLFIYTLIFYKLDIE